MGEEPMNVAASIGMPTSSATRTTGSMSAITVRAAQFGKIGSLWSRISRASTRTCSTTRGRSEEHTSELQSRLHLVCRLLLEKKKNTNYQTCQDHEYIRRTIA